MICCISVSLLWVALMRIFAEEEPISEHEKDANSESNKKRASLFCHVFKSSKQKYNDR